MLLNELSKNLVKNIINESVDKAFISEIKREGKNYVVFFKRPLIAKGVKTIRRIFREGGKKSPKYVKQQLRKEIKQLYFILNDLLEDPRFHMFLKLKQYHYDLDKKFLHALLIYVRGYRVDKESKSEEEVDQKEFYKSLNAHQVHLLFKAILGFKRYAFQQEESKD